MDIVLVVAPHPDDETLGCGGTLLRHRAEGDVVHWLIVTAMDETSPEWRNRIQAREREIEAVARHYGVSTVHRLGFPAARLDSLPRADVVGKIGAVVRTVAPNVLYLPFPGDAHSDHAVTFDACAACTKWFRHPSVRRVCAYETLSETEFGLSPVADAFRPNRFVDVTVHLNGKIEAMRLYAEESGVFPFPRSEEAIRALAALRGSTVGCAAAEAFMTLKEVVR